MTEEKFTSLLPEYLQNASRLYFTPVHVAKMASEWLGQGGVRVLDIGAGVGKFCITGAGRSASQFFGVEYRPSLVNIANNLIDYFGIENVTMSCANIMEIDFTEYDSFYCNNPFYENLVRPLRLNNEVQLNKSLYTQYVEFTEYQLNRTKPGTRLATYNGNNFEVPGSFVKVGETDDRKLKFWIRE